MNENILDKLKCLNYERDFVMAQVGFVRMLVAYQGDPNPPPLPYSKLSPPSNSTQNRRSFTREHFVVQADNSSIQFSDFLDLVIFLVAKIKRDAYYFKIDNLDDPNTSVNKMMMALRGLDFTAEFPAAKLKAAHGEAVCTVLDFLTDKCLESERFVFKMPKHNESTKPDEVDGDDDAVIDDDEIDDEVEAIEEVSLCLSEVRRNKAMHATTH